MQFRGDLSVTTNWSNAAATVISPGDGNSMGNSYIMAIALVYSLPPIIIYIALRRHLVAA